MSTNNAGAATMALDIALPTLANPWQEAPFIFFQNKAGQVASGIRGSINADAIGPNLWGDCRRVTVHHKLAMLRFAGQERLANIQKITTILAIKRHARPSPGMTEKIIADCCRNLKPL